MADVYTYSYPLEAARQNDLGGLVGQCQAAGLPVLYANGSPDAGMVHLVHDRALTQPEQSQEASIVASYDGRRRQPRPLWAIRADVQALTSTQWTKVWADLSAAVVGPPAVPRKYLTDYGTNAGPIFVFDWALYVSGPTAAQQKAGQISLTAMYVQDQPSYLVHPPFDPSISIPGDEPLA